MQPVSFDLGWALSLSPSTWAPSIAMCSPRVDACGREQPSPEVSRKVVACKKLLVLTERRIRFEASMVASHNIICKQGGIYGRTRSIIWFHNLVICSGMQWLLLPSQPTPPTSPQKPSFFSCGGSVLWGGCLTGCFHDLLEVIPSHKQQLIDTTRAASHIFCPSR